MEWELGRNGDKYFLFLRNEILSICIDITECEAKKIEKRFKLKAEEYPF